MFTRLGLLSEVAVTTPRCVSVRRRCVHLQRGTQIQTGGKDFNWSVLRSKMPQVDCRYGNTAIAVRYTFLLGQVVELQSYM